MSKPKISKPISAVARRVRTASVPFAGPLAADSRAQLANLRGRLDAIAADERASPNEKAALARSALAEARDWQRRAEAQAERDVAEVLDAAKRLDGLVRGVEHAVTPVDQLRLQLAADSLRNLPAHERSAHFEKAFERRDFPALMAHSLLNPLDDSGRRALGVLVDRAAFQRLVEDKGAAVANLVAVRQAGHGLRELTERDDPHAVEDLRPAELVRQGNEGVRAIVTNEEVELAVPATAPSWLRSLLVPPRTVVAEQQRPPSDEPQAAGGAA